MKEQGPLTGEQEVELAELQPKAQQWLKQKERDAKRHRAGKATAARVVELEALAEQGPLTGEQEAELAEVQTKVAQQKQKKKEKNAKDYQARKAAAARVAELEALKEQGPLTVEQEAELAELQPKVAQKKQKRNESAANYRRERKAAVARVVELEVLKERGPLTVEQEAELAEVQPKAQQKQKHNESAAKYRKRGKAAAARVAELEELKEQGPLTEEQEKELAELQPKAQQKQKHNESAAKYRRAGKAAVARVAVLEELAERGPLTDEQEAELAELQPRAQQWQKQKENDAKYHRAGKVAAARVAVLEALKEQGQLTEEQEAELAEFQPKVAQQKQKRQEYAADWYRAWKGAVDRVVVLEELEGEGRLTVEQEAELAELRPKAQQWRKKKESVVKNRREMNAAAARVAELEELAEQGPLTEEQEAELAELRSKLAGRGRKKKDRDVTETGVGGPVADRGAGPEGVSGWTGADQNDSDAWSADVDLDAWFARAVADVDGAQVLQGAADAGVMLGEGAYEEFVATELPAFLGQDAGDDAAGVGGAGAVAGGFDFAGFLTDYQDWEGSVGVFGGEGADGLFFGEPFAENAVWPDAGDATESGVLVVADPVAGRESVGAGYRFLPGVNQANYRSGDERYQVNCLEAFVAFHNSLKFNREFVAGLVVIGIRVCWRWRSGRRPCGLVVWLGLSGMCGAGRWVWLYR